MTGRGLLCHVTGRLAVVCSSASFSKLTTMEGAVTGRPSREARLLRRSRSTADAVCGGSAH